MEWADIVMVSNISNYGGPYTARVAEEAVKRGKFVHFDTDDLLTDLYKEHRLYKVYKDNQLDEITKFIYHNSHLVSVTQEAFAKEIQQFTRGGLAIIRNAIDCNLPCWNAPKVKTKQVKIGWAGGIHHRPDVKVFAGVPNIVNSKVGKENVIWDFYGHPPANNPPEEKWQEEAWKEYLSSFARGNNAKNFRVHYAHGPDSYGVFYSNMDIAIAPLADNRFNQMKSDIKVAECFGVDTEILLFNGNIKRVQDIEVGDILMGPDSTPRTVKQLFRGKSPMTRVIPKRGEPFTVTNNHTLVLKTNRIRKETKKQKARTLKIKVCDYEVLTPIDKYDYMLYRSGVEFTNYKSLPLDPYYLGIMLGDGSFTQRIGITSMDPEVLEYWKNYSLSLGDGLACGLAKKKNKAQFIDVTNSPEFRKKFKHPIVEKFKLLGLYGIACKDKFIPQCYKYASFKDRLQILAGLIDTDGCVLKSKNAFSFSNTSIQLMEDIIFVARSCGFYASEMSLQKKRCQRREGYSYWYRTTISGPIWNIPVKIPRKKVVEKKKQITRNCLTSGFKLEPLEGVHDYYGFEIDKDNLFLLGDFTVVHNCTAYGVPLIASDIGCYRDTIVNGKNGYLLPPDASPMDWARVLTKVIKDKQHREEMGRNIKKLRDSYDLNKVVWDRLWLYEKAIEDFKWNFKFAGNDSD